MGMPKCFMWNGSDILQGLSGGAKRELIAGIQTFGKFKHTSDSVKFFGLPDVNDRIIYG